MKPPQSGSNLAMSMALDPESWTGAVDAQRREGRLFVALLVALVLLLAPLVAWFAGWYAGVVLGLD